MLQSISSGLLSLAGSAPLAAISAVAVKNPFMWYVTRASATSSYITLSLLVILGLTRSMIRINGSRISWWLDEAHQFLALLTAGLVGLHLVSLLFDALIPFSLLNILLPVNEPYRAVPVAIGVISMYGMAVVLSSSWLRKRVGQKTWRLLHYLSFAVFAGVTLHGVLAGADSSQPWMIFIYVAAALAVGLLTFLRIFSRPQVQPARAGLPRR
ncbi:MAG TPA: ferric reductase-like transmembrane domain-containing protein [Ktedonobacterales bacterium]